jgi:glycosyltransferase involved in cell wall biosynthesis
MPVCQSSIACVVRGRVGNLAAEYARAEIVIVPILSGTGLKIKLVEAIAHGKAIVSTAAGAQGLEDLAGKTIQVITTPEDFAQRLVEISVDEKYRSDLEAKAEAAAMERFSPEACYAPLARALKRRF